MDAEEEVMAILLHVMIIPLTHTHTHTHTHTPLTLTLSHTHRVDAEEEVKAISLHVLTTNQIAVRFYENNGFTRIKTLSRFYTIDTQPCDAYL